LNLDGGAFCKKMPAALADWPLRLVSSAAIDKRVLRGMEKDRPGIRPRS
jgi:hypothetical protein